MLGNIIVIAIIVVVVFFAARSIVRQHKSGGCSGNCSSCHGSPTCHTIIDDDDQKK